MFGFMNVQTSICDFEKNSKGICSKLIQKMGYNRQGIWKRSHGILKLIVIEHRLKHKGLEFNEQEILIESMITKQAFPSHKGSKNKSIQLKKIGSEKMSGKKTIPTCL